MKYQVYNTHSSTIKDLLNELRATFNLGQIKYEKYKELLILTASTTEEPTIIYIEFKKPLRIRAYKKVVQCIGFFYKKEEEKKLIYRLKRHLENNEKRLNLLSTVNNQELQQKIEALINVKKTEIKVTETLTFMFYCQKENKEKFLKITKEFNIKKLLYIPFVISIPETNNILEDNHILFIGEIPKESHQEFLSVVKEIGINLKNFSFMESSSFST